MTQPAAIQEEHLTSSGGLNFSAVGDAQYYQSRLIEDAVTTFNRSGNNSIETVFVDPGTGMVHLRTYNGLTQDIPDDLFFGCLGSQSMYILRQSNSWSRLLVNVQAVQRILDTHKIFLPFLDFLRSFGYRRDDDERTMNCYRWKTNARRDEYCYNLQYVAHNGRTTGCPWSIRQVGVYEQYDVTTHQSLWILVQPSDHMYSRLKDWLVSKEISNALILHAAILLSTSREWTSYIDSLRTELKKFDEKVAFSRVGRPSKFDYSVTFTDCQHLHLCRKKLLKALTVLQSSIEVGLGCTLRHRSFSQLNSSLNSDSVISDIENYIQQMKTHKAKIESLLQNAEWTSSLLSKILEYRNDEAIRHSEEAIRSNGEALKQITTAIHTENEKFNKLTTQAAQDSKTMKALTFLATLYLPASLIATIFSSNLIQSQNIGQEVAKTHFVVAGQFWIYVLSTMVLTLFTLGCIIVSARWWIK